MQSLASDKAQSLEPAQGAGATRSGFRRILTRKIWLPGLVYEALPVLYALAGLTAIFATVFVSDWYWVLPFYWLLGMGCLDAAQAVWRIRRRHRKSAGQAAPGE